MRLLWTEEAIADRSDIFDYVEADNPAAALALDQLFSDKASRLIEHPMLGRTGRVSGTRELVVHDNFILIYGISQGPVRILRLLHASRQWPTPR